MRFSFHQVNILLPKKCFLIKENIFVLPYDYTLNVLFSQDVLIKMTIFLIKNADFSCFLAIFYLLKYFNHYNRHVVNCISVIIRYRF